MTELRDVVSRILVWLSPLLFVTGLLVLAAWRDRRDLARVARQVRLTDALAEDVGTIVAPVVRKRLGGWRIAIAVPFERPAIVARILRVVHRTLEDLGPDRYEIALSPQAPAPRPVPYRRPAERRPRAA
jgi:hypothetical protein